VLHASRVIEYRAVCTPIAPFKKSKEREGLPRNANIARISAIGQGFITRYISRSFSKLADSDAILIKQCSCGVPSDATDSPAYKTSNFTVHSDLNATFSPEEHPAVLVSAGQLSPAKESGVETGKREDTSGSNSNFANESQRLYGKTVDWRTPAGIGEEGLRAAQYQG
jgi:hypothetical protein